MRSKASEGSLPRSAFSPSRLRYGWRGTSTISASPRRLGANADALAAILLLLLSCHGAHATAEEDVATAIRAALTPHTSLPARTPGHVDTPSPELRVYSDRRYAGLWTHGAKITPQAQQVLVLLSHAQELGLRPDDYDVEPLMAAGMRLVPNGTASAAQAAAFDIQLTQSALHYLHDAHFGRIDPRRVGFELAVPRAPFDSTAVLLDMSGADAGAGTRAPCNRAPCIGRLNTVACRSLGRAAVLSLHSCSRIPYPNTGRWRAIRLLCSLRRLIRSRSATPTLRRPR